MFWPGLSPSASADVLPGFTSHITFKTEVSSAAVVSQQEDTGALAISNNFHSLLPFVLPLDTSTVKIDIEWKYRILIVKPLKKRYNPWLNTPLDLWNVLLSTENMTMWASKAAHKHSLNPLNELTHTLSSPHWSTHPHLFIQCCPYLLGDFASLMSKNRYPRCQWANSLCPSKAKQGPRSSGWYRYTHSSPATMNWESWEGSAREEHCKAHPCVSSSTLGYSLMDRV